MYIHIAKRRGRTCMKRAAIIYWSHSGNTEKVALSIEQGLTSAGIATTVMKTHEATNTDFFHYDLICFGFPSYNWHPPKQADEYLKAKFSQYKKENKVLVGAPPVKGKSVLIFCTYSGPHTGIREAVPAVRYAGQFFEHLGFTVADEWYVLSEFHGSEEMSTRGRMGNIKGLPSAQDLERIESQARILIERL
jgi:flavorubredoxin